jgi:RNA ligase
MTSLSDVLDVGMLEEMVAQGYVRVGRHPVLPLRILNYTAAAQYERVWNDVTGRCRGLIVDADDRVVARPFAKFFNFGEWEPERFSEMSGRVEVTDKLDGSLGVLYPSGDMWAVATRGSFVSDQAQHATEVLLSRYGGFEPNPGWTYLFEIVYPANRIVVEYGGLDDLVLLGAVDVASGRSVPLSDVAASWAGPVVDVLPFTDLAQAVSSDPRPNREGMVVHFVDHDVRVKVKYDEYVRLHRMVTGLSTTVIFDHLRSGGPLSELIENVPDELFAAVDEVVADLSAKFSAAHAEVVRLHREVVAEVDPVVDRRGFAQRVLALDFPLKHSLFALQDGRSFDGAIWESVKPPFRRIWGFDGDDS